MKQIICRMVVGILAMYLMGLSHPLSAQQVQIPTMQVCNQTTVKGKAAVKILSRGDAMHSGVFEVTVDLACIPPGYPAGSLTINNISMSDSSSNGAITAATFEQITA